MAIQIEMPKLSDTMTEGTVVRWLKNVGDQVEIGDEIAEIETDKATMVMEAFDEGTLSEILIEEGGKAGIGATLAVLQEEGDESVPPAAPSAEQAAPEADVKPVAIEAHYPDQSPPAPAPAPAVSAPSAPSAPTPAPAPVEEQAAAADAVPLPEEDARIKASPLARKIAAANGIDLANLQGSGPGGRIVKKDVDGALSGGTSAAPAPAPAAPRPAAEPVHKEPEPAPAPAAAPVKREAPPAPAAVTPDAGHQRVELSKMRQIIAERLLASKTTIPHFYLHMEADAGPLMDIRKQVNAQAEATHGNKYTVNDFILKAVINALQAVPAVNASFNGDHIVQYSHIGVAVAVAVDDGLVTPVVKDAAAKSLLQISREVKDLAGRAREGKLLPNEFDGGSITVSNLGAYGVDSFDAIINPPQAAILSVGAIAEKAVVVDGEVVPGLRLNIGLSCDHRVVDGAVGAGFLAQVKKLIEQPALMLV